MDYKRTSLRIFLVITGFLVVLGVAGLLLQHFLNDKVKELFIRELNKQLTTEVQVDQVSLSLFRDFPYASVRFSGVRLKEAGNHPNKELLLKAGMISLRFGLPDLLRSRFTVSNILVKDARLKIHIYPDGSDNYHCWKSNPASKGKDFSIDIQKISFVQTHISYLDEQSGNEGAVQLSDAIVKGKFSEKKYLLQFNGSTHIEKYISDNVAYINHRDANFDIALEVNNPQKTYTFKKSEISLNELTLNTSGWLIDRKDRKELDLSISTSEATLKELVSTLPESYRKKLDGYRYSGNAVISIHINGSFGDTKNPAITAKLTLNDGVIGRRHSSVSMENVNLTLLYNLGQDKQGEKLTINGFQAKIKNGTIAGNLAMDNLKSPFINAALKTDVVLEDVRQFLDLDTIRSMQGRLLIDGHFNGRIADLNHPTVQDFEKSILSGNAEIRQGELGLEGYKMQVEKINGKIVFNNNNLRLDHFDFQVGKSDFKAQGSINNLMAWLFLKNQKLNLQGIVSSSRTDWDELSESSSGSGEYNFQLPDDLQINKLQVHLKNFTFRKFTAPDISATIQLNNRMLVASNILMQSMQGIVSGQGSINATNSKYSILQCNATLNKVNLKSMFAEFGNFGSTDLTSSNLDGAVTADVVFAATMLPNLDLDAQSVKVHANIRVENGRLVNYSPMLGLSKFLRVEDLSDIRFATLQNQIDIANKIIYIPGMQIKSSALDLSLMGTHTFNNELEYHFSIALADLLAAKFHRKNPSYISQSEFGTIEDDGRGRTMIFVSMTGTVDDPKFSYDKKAVREKIASEMKNQKAELKEAFRREFGSMQQDTLRKSQNIKEKAIQKKQEEGKFVIEWDDDKK